MSILSDSVLVESKSARDNQLVAIPDDRATEVLNKAKSIAFAVWEGSGLATTEQMAEFYEVSPEVVRDNVRRHRDEFEADGLEVLKGKALKDVRETLSLTPDTPQATVWTPRASLRLGMLLQNSPVAKQVRTILLNGFESAGATPAGRAAFTDVFGAFFQAHAVERPVTPETPLPPSPLTTDLALIRSLLQVKPSHPFIKWQGSLLATTEAVANWLEISLEQAQGHYKRRTPTFQALGMITRTLPKTLRTKLGVSEKTNNLRLWTPRALVHLAALVASTPAQQLTALAGSAPQLAALSLDDQISELYQRAVEAESVAVRSGKSALLLYLELGAKLTQRKADFKHGEWIPWLKAKGIHDRRAQRAMQLWEGRDQIEGALKDLTLTQALNQLGKKTIAAVEPEPATIDVTPVDETPTPYSPPTDPKLLVLDRLQQATATATQIEALPAGSTLKIILTGQLSRAVQLMNFEDLTKDITPTKPVVEPDPITVSDYAKLNGKPLSPFQVQQAGIRAAWMYRNRHGSNPPQRSAAINGNICQVNLYPAADWDLVESAISLAVEA